MKTFLARIEVGSVTRVRRRIARQSGAHGLLSSECAFNNSIMVRITALHWPYLRTGPGLGSTTVSFYETTSHFLTLKIRALAKYFRNPF